MTSEKKVRLAVKILGPGSQKEVELALDRMEGEERMRVFDALKQNKELRKRIGRLKGTLIRLRADFRGLPDSLRLPLQETSSPFFHARKTMLARRALKSDWGSIENWTFEDSSSSTVEQTETSPGIDVLIDIFKRFEQKYRPGKPKRDDAFHQRLAAEESYRLLVKHGKPTTTGKNDPFCTLAAIHCNEKAATVQRYCREVARDKTGSK